MRFKQPIKPGRDASIEYDAIQWDETTLPETYDCTGQRVTLDGRVKQVVKQGQSVDAHFVLSTSYGEFMVFANGDVFELLDGQGDSELVGIKTAVTVNESHKVVA